MIKRLRIKFVCVIMAIVMVLLGCILGTALIVVVENSMILIGIPTVWKDFFVGALIIIGTGISAMRVFTANKPGANVRKEAAR